MEREQTTIRLPVELKEQLQQEADRLGVSFNGLVVNYLWKVLEQKEHHVLFHNRVQPL